MPEQVPSIIDMTEWAAWFAWRPIRLYMSGKIVWLNWVFRRCVTHGNGFQTCDYTTEPDEFPRLIPAENTADQRRPDARLGEAGLS
jgi:hypothetical protein